METFKPNEGCQELLNHPGFYISKKYPKYAANSEGVIRNAVTGELANLSSMIPGKILHYRVDNSHIEAHRVVADVFLKDLDPEEIGNERTVVNHINGDPTDNRVSNLEYTTFRGNNWHAIITGLRKDGHALLCKNIDTGEIVEYPSMGLCALKLMAPKGLLDYYLNKLDRSKFVLNGKYVIIKKGEEWPVLVSNTKPYYAITNDWVIIDKKAKTATIYKYLDNVSKVLNMDQHLIKTLIYEELIGKEKRALRFGDKTLMNYDSWISMIKKSAKSVDLRDKLKRTKQGGSNPCRIQVEDLITGETKIWESSEIFAKEVLHMGKKSFQRNVHRNKGYYCNTLPGSSRKSQKLYKITYLSPTKE